MFGNKMTNIELLTCKQTPMALIAHAKAVANHVQLALAQQAATARPRAPPKDSSTLKHKSIKYTCDQLLFVNVFESKL